MFSIMAPEILCRWLQIELSSLQSNLERLDAFLERDSQVNSQFTHTSALTTSTNGCCDKLEKLRISLRDKLSDHRKSRKSILKWPLSVTDHRKTIGELRAFSHCIQLALTTILVLCFPKLPLRCRKYWQSSGKP